MLYSSVKSRWRLKIWNTTVSKFTCLKVSLWTQLTKYDMIEDVGLNLLYNLISLLGISQLLHCYIYIRHTVKHFTEAQLTLILVAPGMTAETRSFLLNSNKSTVLLLSVYKYSNGDFLPLDTTILFDFIIRNDAMSKVACLDDLLLWLDLVTANTVTDTLDRTSGVRCRMTSPWLIGWVTVTFLAEHNGWHSVKIT